MHIPDWDERFLSEFDADAYVEMLARAQVQSAVVYAHSHVGLCTYPTKVGRMHRGLKGQNILAEVIERCHRRGISVVVYVSLIYDRWADEAHPDWRIVKANGAFASEGSRHGLLCPNSPYREYVVALTEELCERFDFEGIRFDMTFWPCVCYCRYCRKRFDEEVGGELPRLVNWEEPRWVGFQHKREEWLAEFASLATSTVKRLKPCASVEHQASTYILHWGFGVTEKLVPHNDFLQGDFYGDALQGSFVRKFLYNLSPNLPYGFETSICVELANHTTMKSQELLIAKACAAVADGGAFVFIDAIDPVGTLNPAVYERMGAVFEETKRYDPYRGGEMCQDVAVYFSMASKFDLAENGKAVDSGFSHRVPHQHAAVSACKSLITHHIPYGVITKKDLRDLARHQLLVLPEVLVIDEEEATAIREWVHGGGSLYASRHTSLIAEEGRRRSHFLLADVFGVSYCGETGESVTYVAPVAGKESLFGGHTAKYPAYVGSSQVLVTPRDGAEVLGTITLPYTDPADPTRFSSIHSNPPGRPTTRPAVVLNRFGKGAAIYAAGDLESSPEHRETFVRLLGLIARPFSLEVDGPKAVEATLFHQPDRGRFIVNLLNFQSELPNIPVDGIRVRLRLDGRQVRRVLVVPEERELPHAVSGAYVEFAAPRLETFRMLAVDYRTPGA